MLFIDVAEPVLRKRAAAAGKDATFDQRFQAFLKATMPVVEGFAARGAAMVVPGDYAAAAAAVAQVMASSLGEAF
jgi:hypothetical protein